MDRAAYNKCMIPFMKGGGPDRKLRFCIGAKTCSGKAKSEAEAEQICINQPAREPKPHKGSRHSIDPVNLATCMSTKMNMEGLTVDNLPARLESAIKLCSMTKAGSPPTYKRFMTSCIKETGSGGGDWRDSQPDIKKCQAKWNELRGA